MTKLNTALLISIAALATAASAQTAPATAATSPIKLTASTSKVTMVKDAAGKMVEKLEDAAGKGVLPKDLLEFNQKIQNVGKVNVNKVSVTMPVSSAVTYQSQKCSSTVAALFSVDGKNYANPLKKSVTVNGVTKEVAVEPSEYKFVRWTLPTVKAGDTINCAVRVKVN